MAESEVGRSHTVDLEMLELSPGQGKQPLVEKGEEQEPPHSGENTRRSSKASPGREGKPGQSLEVTHWRPKQPGQSRIGSSSRSHKANGHLEEKRQAGAPPSRERGRDKPESSREKQPCTRDSRPTKARVRDRKPQASSPVRDRKRRGSGDTPGAPSHLPKRHRQHSPEASSSWRHSALSRVTTHMGALEVVLGYLQAPGGAFLPVPSSSKEPTVSQRAWLTWQLSHAGAALHWALHTVDSILAHRPAWPDNPSHWPLPPKP